MVQLRSVLTRRRILIALAFAVNDRSFEKSSIVQIARNAGVTPGAFYFHFASKDQAAMAVLSTQAEYSQSKAAASFVPGAPTIEGLLVSSATLMIDIVQDPLVRAGIRLSAELGLLETFQAESSQAQVWQSWSDFNAETLSTARDEGAVHLSTDVVAVGELLVASIAGVFLMCSLEQDLTRLLPRIHEMWRQFIDAHTTEPAHWRTVASSLFEIPAPRQFTLEETLARHGPDSASVAQSS